MQNFFNLYREVILYLVLAVLLCSAVFGQIKPKFGEYMSIKKDTPCNYGVCPYHAEYHCDCEYWCGVEKELDYSKEYEEEEN